VYDKKEVFMVTLKKAFGILSKSSPYAVSTVREDTHHEYHQFKNYLYIKTSIQERFEQIASQLTSGQIIFLCGSSGDGKSELLTRYKDSHSDKFIFHLDGTHSFKPNETAIQALDQRFTEFKSSDKPLIIGINTGMLGNYLADGLDDHEDIKVSIHAFLKGKDVNENHHFIDFSNRSILSEGNRSFALKLIEKLTDPVEINPFHQLYLSECTSSKVPSILHNNYRLLSNPAVQKQIDNLLNSVRLKFDQFITARAVLDFVYELLNEKRYLFDVLFTDSENELLRYMSQLDPSQTHSYELDQFKLQFNLKLLKPGFQSFIDDSKKQGVDGFDSADSVLRFMLLMQSDDGTSEEVKELIGQTTQSVVLNYISAWMLHNNYKAEGGSKQELNNFYREKVISAIHRYCNRHAHEFSKGQYFLYELNGYKVACDLEIKADFESIITNRPNEASFFYVCLNINGREARPIPINVNLMELLTKINNGYRPNKQDKNAILILDEIVDLVREVGGSMDTLYIYHAGESLKVTNEDNEYFEVSGL
jgi:DNA phosphorothioation-dependent restriction protein DptF